MEDNKTEEIVAEMTAGEMLRNARTTGRRKREIATIAKQLCIREEFLQALEDGNYTFIPELVYILGFARNYAMELGLNPDEIVAKIKQELGVVSDVASADDDDGLLVTKIQKQKSNDAVSMGFWAHVLTFLKKYWMWVAGFVAVLLIIIVAMVFAMSGSDESDAPVANVAVVETVAEPAFTVPVRERWGVDNSKDAKVVLQALRDSWIKVEDARGRTEFSRVLVKGDIYYVPADGKFTATFGDAGGIDIWVDKKLAPKAGPDHERKSDISLAPEKLMSAKAPTAPDKTEAKTDEKPVSADAKTE